MEYIRVSDALHLGLGDIVSDSGYSKEPILIAFLGDIPEAVLVSPSKIVIGTHFVLIGLSSDALARIPLIACHSHTEDMIGRELLLSQIGRQTELVLLPIHEVMEVRLDEDSLLDVVTIGFGMQHFLDLVVHWVLFYLAEAEVSGVYWPVVGTLLLLSGIVILMRFEVLLADLFGLWHIFPGVDGVLNSVLILLGGDAVPELGTLGLVGQLVASVDSPGQWLPLERVILALLQLLHEITHALLVSGLHDIPNSLGLLGGYAVGEGIGREGIVDSAVVMLRDGEGTIVVPNCSL